MKESKLKTSSFQYVNWVNSVWEHSLVEQSNLRESFMSEVKLKKTSFEGVDFTQVDFFKTILKGVDLSNCIIDAIMVSDTFQELKGAKVSMEQTVAIAQLLGLKVI